MADHTTLNVALLSVIGTAGIAGVGKFLLGDKVYGVGSKTLSDVGDKISKGKTLLDEVKDTVNRGNLLYSGGGVGYTSNETTFNGKTEVKEDTFTDVKTATIRAPVKKIEIKPVKRPDYGQTRDWVNEVRESNINYYNETTKYHNF